MKKWEKFSESELKEIILNSQTYKEALQKIGYNGSSNYNHYIKEISQKYNIDISHFPTGQVIDLTGQKFGKLTVIQRVPNKNGGTARWLCQCECGNLTEIDGTKLRRNEIQSCGCLLKKKIIKYNKDNKLINLAGQKFGKLTVIQRANNIGQQPAWLCQCECGNQVVVMGSNLRKDNGTQSCGCLCSKGELKIITLLKQNNINFKTQIKFKDCISNKNALLKFDFGIYNDDNKLLYLIEYDGEQHYKQNSWGHDNWKERIERDIIKNIYCKKNKIPLIRIPYTHYNDLCIDDLLEKSTFFINEEI